jgi:transcription termination factor Rho
MSPTPRKRRARATGRRPRPGIELAASEAGTEPPVDEPVGDEPVGEEPVVDEPADEDETVVVGTYRPVRVKRAPPLPGQPEAEGPARLEELGVLPMPELIQRLRHYGIEAHEGIDRAKLLVKFMRKGESADLDIRGEGQLEVLPDGYGFLRSARNSFLPSPDDLYVSPALVQQHLLRAGMTVSGPVRGGQRKQKYFALGGIDQVNGEDPEKTAEWKPFDELTPVFPDQRILLETPEDPRNFSARVVDLIAPIGFGQRGLIVSPPRAGKTMLLKSLAHAIEANHPDAKLLVLLVDERPEEVTDMVRNIKGEVIASTFDESPQRHVQVAERVVDRARSLVESGKDVIVMLDSLTRLGRAYNSAARTTGRIMSGGLESNALQKPRRFFGSARNIEHGGSLTILATALIETNSRMDEVIFEEFKGTGNMEIVLSRAVSENRIFPAIDINKSGTRMEGLLYDPDEAKLIKALRGALADLPPVEAIEKLLEHLRRCHTNAEFLLTIANRRVF